VRAGFITEPQFRGRLSGLEFLGEPQHVVVRAANHAVAAHLGRVGGREADGDGRGVHIQADKEHGIILRVSRSSQHFAGRAGGDRARPWGAAGVLRLDSFGFTE
jgi:hypothetical protein